MGIFDQLKTLAGTAVKATGSAMFPIASQAANTFKALTAPQKAATLSKPASTNSLFTTRTSTTPAQAAKGSFTINSSMPKPQTIASPTMIGQAPVIKAPDGPGQPPVSLNMPQKAAAAPVAPPVQTKPSAPVSTFAASEPAMAPRSMPLVGLNTLSSTASSSPSAFASSASTPDEAMNILAGNPTSGDAGSLNSQLAALRESYRSSIAPTDEERAASAALRDIIAKQANLSTSTDLGLNQISDQPIVMDLIRGQQATLQRQAATKMGALEAQAKPLEMQLAELQALRQARSKTAETDLNFALEDEKLRASQATASKPIEVNGSLVQLNPQTGRYETVYQGTPKATNQPATVQEYQFYADQERQSGRQPMTFNEYQTMDANRKAQIAGSNGLDTKQTQNFLSISNRYQADSIIQNGLKGSNAIAIADQVLKDPNNAANQLKALYTLVSSLDPNSAVREGEIALANQTQSYLQRFGTDLQRIFQGQTISGDAAQQLALATKDLASVWFQAAQRRDKQYQSQAQVTGVGGAFDQYLQGFDRPYSNQSSSNQSSGDPLDQALDGLGFKRDPSMSVNGSLPKVGKTVSSSLGSGTITAYGSPLWKPGLDFVLQGGPNAPVKMPFSGTVVRTGPNGGFGNQVRVRTDDGKEVWISHLNAINVKPGARITPGTVIGLQGNTGNVIKGPGGTGTHLDITMPKPDGGYYTAEDVARYIGATA